MDLSIVIPVYNSEDSLPLLLDELQQVLPTCVTSYEAVLVNDGSKDGSWSLLVKIRHQYPWLAIIDLTQNYGQHRALLVGIQHSRGDIVVTLDDDLQTPPSEIPKLLAMMTDRTDVVYGTRPKEKHGILRNTASRMTKLFLKRFLNVPMAADITSFRAFRGTLRQNFHPIQNGSVFIDALLAGATQHFASVPVRHDARTIGSSNYSLGKLLQHGVDVVTSFSVLPLQLASLLGFAFTSLGGFLLVYILVSYLSGTVHVPGFTFLAAVICLFSGTQMIVLGIFGAYLARIYQSLRETRKTFVREILFQEQ